MAEPLDRIREIALALPGAAELPSHGVPGFPIIRASSSPVSGTITIATGAMRMIVKTRGTDDQAILIEADPDLCFRLPYSDPPAGMADRIAASWERVAPLFARNRRR